MKNIKLKPKNNNKFLFLICIICFSSIITYLIGLNSYNTYNQTTNDYSPYEQDDDNNLPINTHQIFWGNLTRKWEPIIFNLSTLPPSFNGLSWGNIRVTVYDADTARWYSVPFQIDELGARFEWQDGTYTTLSEINTTTTFGFIGLDTNGMGGGIFGEDELVFYAHDGDRVSPTMWWEGDAGGTYPNRLEISIIDPVDGGRGWMYIYYDNTINHGDPTLTWVDYPFQGWNASEFKAYGSHYAVIKNKTNPDIELELFSDYGAKQDLFNESFKSYTAINLFNITYAYSEILTIGREGIWNSTYYSDRKTELQFPENTSLNGFLNEGGDGTVICDGPIRTIVRKRIFYNINSSLLPTPLNVIQHQDEVYYMNSKIMKITKELDTLGLFNATVDYDYDLVTSINKSIRSDILVYTGWRNGTLIQNKPNGIANETSELISTGGPTGPNPDAPPKLNPEVPDFIFFTSSTSGSAWLLCPREQYNNTNSGTYWKDDNSTSEIGFVIANVTPSGKLILPIKWVYLGSITSPAQAKIEGIKLYRQAKNPLSIMTQVQSRPVDNTPPVIHEPIQVPSPSVNNDTTTVYANITDDRAGVHRAFVVFSNSTGTYALEMTYISAYGLYAAEIPKHPYKSNISYFIYANDTFGNIGYTPFDYLGAFSFTFDPNYAPPNGWAINASSNTYAVVVPELVFHRKVVEFYDNNVTGNAQMISSSFGPIVEGQVEWWVYGIEGVNLNGKFYMEFMDSSNTTGILLQANWDVGAKTLSRWDGSNWIVIANNFENNNYRIRPSQILYWRFRLSYQLLCLG
ncbi:MAG: hypothetical protein ACTSRP_24945 [Candidatus Helarchaeota archaeon]